MSHPLHYFWNVVKAPGVSYVLGKQRRRRRGDAGARNSFPVPPPCVLLAPELSSVFQQLSEHLARVRDEGNKKQIALSTHLAPKAP